MTASKREDDGARAHLRRPPPPAACFRRQLWRHGHHLLLKRLHQRQGSDLKPTLDPPPPSTIPADPRKVLTALRASLRRGSDGLDVQLRQLSQPDINVAPDSCPLLTGPACVFSQRDVNMRASTRRSNSATRRSACRTSKLLKAVAQVHFAFTLHCTRRLQPGLGSCAPFPRPLERRHKEALGASGRRWLGRCDGCRSAKRRTVRS
jgi:hypothetical protein